MVVVISKLKNGKFLAKANYGPTQAQGDTAEESKDCCLAKVSEKIRKLEEKLGFKLHVM